MNSTKISKEVAIKIAQALIGPTVNELTAPEIIDGVEVVIRPLVEKISTCEAETSQLRNESMFFGSQLLEFGELLAHGHFNQGDCMIHITVRKLREAMKISFPGLFIILKETLDKAQHERSEG